MTLNEKKLSIQRLLAFGFEVDRADPNSFLYYYQDNEIIYNYLRTHTRKVWYVDIVIAFSGNLEMMYKDIFSEDGIDPEALLDHVKKLAAAVEFIKV
jgi:hypothetical protein